jgi:hypothetical protein
MELAVLSSTSKKDIQLLVAIAQKMGIDAKFLTKDELEDYGMSKAIREGKTREYINTSEFLESLK